MKFEDLKHIFLSLPFIYQFILGLAAFIGAMTIITKFIYGAHRFLFRLIRIKRTGSPIYIVEWGVKRWIKNPVTLSKMGYWFGDEDQVSKFIFDLYPTGKEIDLVKKYKVQTLKPVSISINGENHSFPKADEVEMEDWIYDNFMNTSEKDKIILLLRG